MDNLNIWQFLAGLGLFLYGMHRLEDALQALAGKKFKIFLKKYTTNKILAIFNGAITTALLQSSSVVLLLTIAFAGAGILSLSNSLGIILGANLGTTLTGWVVSIIGFNFNIESFSLPMIAVGSLGIMFANKKFSLYKIFEFLIAFGLLFLGLSYMKNGMQKITEIIDLTYFSHLGLISFFILGFLVTALIHSSSAMMTIALGALYAKIINLDAAIFIVLGADIGTTMTAIYASLQGSVIKKRVGVAHFLFNLVTGVLGVLLYKPILMLIQNVFEINDPMLALPAFHSTFNFLGIILFLPFLNLFEKLLNNLFTTTNNNLCKHIAKAETNPPDIALNAVKLELNEFIKRIHYYIFSNTHQSDENYTIIKKTEDALLDYFSILQNQSMDENESNLLNRYILSLRNGVLAAKSIKNIQHNFKELNESVLEYHELFLEQMHENYSDLRFKIQSIDLLNEQPNKIISDLKSLQILNEQAYQKVNAWIYKTHSTEKFKSIEIGSTLNVNREVFVSHQYLLDATTHMLGI